MSITATQEEINEWNANRINELEESLASANMTIMHLGRIIRDLEKEIDNWRNNFEAANQNLRNVLNQSGVDLPTEQKYGPHHFVLSKYDSSDVVSADCACGASEGAVAGCGATLSPAPDPLPNPHQCRLNPIS